MSKQGEVEQHSRPPAGDGALVRRSVVSALAAVGVAGPIIFAVVALVQSLLRPEHSLVADPNLLTRHEIRSAIRVRSSALL